MNFHGDLGPGSFVWDHDGTPITINNTFGASIFKMEDQFADIFDESQGVAPKDASFTGRLISIEIPEAEITVAQMESLIYLSTLTTQALAINNPVGVQMYALSKKMYIKPIRNGVPSVTKSEWLEMFHAYPVNLIEWSYDNATQRVKKAMFKCFMSQVSGQVGQYGTFGVNT